MKTRYLPLALLYFLTAFLATAQQAPFNIRLEPRDIPGLSGVQSYAFGQYNGKWLILGGRTDGLHRRQPFASFDPADNNARLLVVDPQLGQQWAAPLSPLPTPIREQLASTNMCFHQEGGLLYLVGGYSYSETAGDHVTFEKLCAVKVDSVIDAIVAGKPYLSFFRQISDPRFAVTGGRLEKIYGTHYLVGGQRFEGRYNPMNHPTFVQTYTNQIRKFRIFDDGTNLQVQFLPAFTDTANLHRRDFNVSPQIMPDGKEGLTAFSGVFRTDVDAPYLNCVNIDSSGYQTNNSFSQYYNHYHCSNLPLYSANSNEMHTVFFGGIAQYFDVGGVLTQDPNVPFVKTIARVTRDRNGRMAEFKLPVEMPALLGAGSEFIPAPGIPSYHNGVINLDEIRGETQVGYIFGGISSSQPNVFFGTGTESTASARIFRVFLSRVNTGIDELNTQSTGTLQLQVYPNPSHGDFHIEYDLQENTALTIQILDNVGKPIWVRDYAQRAPGHYVEEINATGWDESGVYMVRVATPREKAVQRIVME